MSDYDRFVFISKLNGPVVGMGALLRQFLEDATAYHERGEVTGLLIYGNGYIFHCFECKKGGMDKLKQDVRDYPYHHDQKLIYEVIGVNPLFINWRLIYAINEPLIKNFLAKHSWKIFNPYIIEHEVLDEFIQIIELYANADQQENITSQKSSTKKVNSTFSYSITDKLSAVTAVIICIIVFIIYTLYK